MGKTFSLLLSEESDIPRAASWLVTLSSIILESQTGDEVRTYIPLSEKLYLIVILVDTVRLVAQRKMQTESESSTQTSI